MIISPSLLSADFSRLKEEVIALDNAGADWIHLDIMDGSFVPNITFGAPIIKAIRPHTKLTFDVHLMIDNPSKYIDDFISAGADIVTVHYEAETHLNRAINYIKSKGVKAGVSLNPATPISALSEIIYDVDLVLIMSVNPGFAAQKMIERSFNKVSETRQMIEKTGRNVIIEVDGGVNDITGKRLKECGADALVAGNYIFANGDYKKKINILKNL